MKKNVLHIVIGVILFCVLLNGCAKSIDYTGQLKNVQKVTPFEIKVPKYFPEDMKNLPMWVTGPDAGDFPGSTWISLTFTDDISNKIIIIDEQNSDAYVSPGSLVFEYFEVQGTNILEETTNIQIPKANGVVKTENGYIYSWSRNGILFGVRVTGINTTEYRKMVQSMIE